MAIIERPIFKEITRSLSDSRIIVITGMRRVGKTTAVRWLLNQIPTNNKLFMDLDRLDQRAVFEEQNYDLVMNYFRNQGLDLSKQITIALEVKYHPVETDQKKLEKIAKKHNINNYWIIGRSPTPGFKKFVWGGSIL